MLEGPAWNNRIPAHDIQQIPQYLTVSLLGNRYRYRYRQFEGPTAGPKVRECREFERKIEDCERNAPLMSTIQQQRRLFMRTRLTSRVTSNDTYLSGTIDQSVTSACGNVMYSV